MNPDVNSFTSASTDPALPSPASAVVACPFCAGDIAVDETNTEWRACPYCSKRLLMRVWPIVRQNSNAATALSDQATCFFHPDKAFQACCQRCGRFLCALCDLQLGSEHVCPSCFERGRADSDVSAAKAEWRYRDVHYDSIALTVGWGWILFWPSIVVALPAVIFLHVRYRKAPRSYLIPRSGWRFWMAYVGLAWLPLIVAAAFLGTAGRH